MVEIVSACAIALTLVQPAAASATAGPARQNPSVEPAVSTGPENLSSEPPARTITGLYVSLAALQALDVYSTMSVLSDGGVEANPAMRGITRHPALFIAVKAAATATTIWVSEKLRKKHPKGAVALMVALNSVMAVVVANNYRH